MSMELRGTTICAVRKNGHTSIAGDGQVTMGRALFSSLMPTRFAVFMRRLTGFAGAVADAFTLCDKFEEKLTQCGGNLERAAVALALMWRSDSGMRQLRTQMIVGGQQDTLLVVSGTARSSTRTRTWSRLAPAGTMRWLRRSRWCRTPTSPRMTLRKRLHIAASICVFTNDNVIVEDV